MENESTQNIDPKTEIVTNIKILEACAKKIKTLTENFKPESKHPTPGYSLSMEPDDIRKEDMRKSDEITYYALQAQKTTSLLSAQKDHLTNVQFHAIQNRITEITECCIKSIRLDTAVELTKTIASGTFEDPTSTNNNRDKDVEKFLLDIYTAYNTERASYNSSDKRHRHSDSNERYKINKIVEGITKQIKNGEFGTNAQNNTDLNKALKHACPPPVVYDEMSF